MISKEGLNLIKSHEGLRLEKYLAPEGQWTVGYGHVIRSGEELDVIDEAEAEALLIEDIKVAERAVDRFVEVPLNENERAALVSFVFNVGSGSFAKSTLRRKLNAGNREGAAEEFTRWVYATVDGQKKTLPGLVKRRNDERALFLKPFRKPLRESRTIAGGCFAVMGACLAAANGFPDFGYGYLELSGTAIAACGGGLAVFARIDDRKRGRN